MSFEFVGLGNKFWKDREEVLARDVRHLHEGVKLGFIEALQLNHQMSLTDWDDDEYDAEFLEFYASQQKGSDSDNDKFFQESHFPKKFKFKYEDPAGRHEPNRFFWLFKPGEEFKFTQWIVSKKEVKQSPWEEHVGVPPWPWKEVNYTAHLEKFIVAKGKVTKVIDAEKIEGRPSRGLWDYDVKNGRDIQLVGSSFNDFNDYADTPWTKFSVLHLFALVARLKAFEAQVKCDSAVCLKCFCPMEDRSIMGCDDWKCPESASERYIKDVCHVKASVLEKVSKKKTVEELRSYRAFLCGCHPYVAFAVGEEQYAWISKQVTVDEQFRVRFMETLNHPLYGSDGELGVYIIKIELPLFLDKLGSMIGNSMVSTKSEMDVALSWLSTLGGAFSALGDLSKDYAEEAGKISLRQLKIAYKMYDPLMQSRCRIYMGISLIQRDRLTDAKRLIRREYQFAVSLPDGMDPKLRRMCLGVWSKLQYAWECRRQQRKAASRSLDLKFNLYNRHEITGNKTYL